MKGHHYKGSYWSPIRYSNSNKSDKLAIIDQSQSWDGTVKLTPETPHWLPICFLSSSRGKFNPTCGYWKSLVRGMCILNTIAVRQEEKGSPVWDEPQSVSLKVLSPPQHVASFITSNFIELAQRPRDKPSRRLCGPQTRRPPNCNSSIMSYIIPLFRGTS